MKKCPKNFYVLNFDKEDFLSQSLSYPARQVCLRLRFKNYLFKCKDVYTHSTSKLRTVWLIRI